MNSTQRLKGSLGVLLLIGGLIGILIFIPIMEILFTSGWNVFLGQVLLARESGGVDLKRYVTHALLLGEIDLDEIENGRMVHLPDVAYFWAPEYLGFPEASLSNSEIRYLVQVLQSGRFYMDQANGNMCYNSGSKSWNFCEAGEELEERYRDVRFSAERTNQAYSAQMHLEMDHFAEVRLYLYEGVLAYETIQPNHDSLYGLALVENALFDELAERFSTGSIPILWSDYSTERANRIAARRLGQSFDRALDELTGSSALDEILGPIEVIRPAAGENRASFWMDSSNLQSHFYVRGEQGEGVVLRRGYRCFDAELIFQGDLIELFQGEGC